MPQTGYDLQQAAKEFRDGCPQTPIKGQNQYLGCDLEDAFIAGAQWARAKNADLNRPPLAMRPDVEISAPLDYVEVQDPPPSALGKLLQSLRSRF